MRRRPLSSKRQAKAGERLPLRRLPAGQCGTVCDLVQRSERGGRGSGRGTASSLLCRPNTLVRLLLRHASVHAGRRQFGMDGRDRSVARRSWSVSAGGRDLDGRQTTRISRMRTRCSTLPCWFYLFSNPCHPRNPRFKKSRFAKCERTIKRRNSAATRGCAFASPYLILVFNKRRHARYGYQGLHGTIFRSNQLRRG